MNCVLFKRLLLRSLIFICMCIVVFYLSTSSVSNTPTASFYLNLSTVDFELIHKPLPHREDFLSVIVSSAVDNFQRRQVIRQTWGLGERVYFLIGGPTNSSLQMMIDQEAADFGDIIQGSFTDTYRNLTYKSVMGLVWSRDFCNSSFILKVDDDLYVNINSVKNFLKKEVKLPTGIYCQVAHHSPVIRSPKSYYRKWLVTRQEYSEDFYPDYCQGSFGVLFERSVISTLLDQVQNIPFFWLEDVYITGLLREQTSLQLAQIPSNKLVYELIKFKFSDPDSIYLGPVGLSADDMLHLWQNITSTSKKV